LKKYASPSSQALEIGCGGGRVTATGVTLFNHVCAADLSAEMLRKCTQAVPAANVTFHKLDGFTLSEFADSSMDFVYSHDVFVQLSSMQVYPYLMEIKRVLKTGGSAMVSCYDIVDRFDLFKDTSLKLWNARQFPIYRRLHFVTEDMLRRMLSDLELEVLEVQKGRFITVALRKNT
jgi:ubiquinone/menaquinone biosynthesis C-methylase UbiE